MEERRGEIEGAVLEILKLCNEPMFCFDSKFKVIGENARFRSMDFSLKSLFMTKTGKLKEGVISSIKNYVRTIQLKTSKESFILHITPLCPEDKEKGVFLCSIHSCKYCEKGIPEEKKEFLKILAHELKSPLSSIGLGIDYVLNVCKKDKKFAMKKIHPFIKKMKKQTFQLMSMIENYLDMSKFEEGIFEPTIERFSVKELLSDIKELSQPLFFGKEVKFKMEKGKKLPEEVEGDSEMIKRIVMNFVCNAAKFTEKGFVTLRTEKVDNELVFSVIDTGCGIEKDDFEKIFQPYKRGKNVGKRSPGLGLGLSIAKKLVSLLDGSIEMESETQKGSKFSLRIPIYEKK